MTAFRIGERSRHGSPPASGFQKKVRKHLSADALYALVGGSFAQVPDPRRPHSPIPLPDALMSAFAMFSLKDPSLLAFDQRRSDGNLKTLFGIGQIPSDTQMREILDEVDPEHLRDAFGDVFRQLQRGKALEPFVFYAGAYLLSLDGTGYFSSPTIHCASCQVKEHKDGTVTYQHQMLGAVIVHPDIKEVIPLAPEPIQKQDGSHQERLRAERGKATLAQNPPATSASEVHRHRGRSGQQRPARPRPDRQRDALHSGRKTRGPCVSVRAGGGGSAAEDARPNCRGRKGTSRPRCRGCTACR